MRRNPPIPARGLVTGEAGRSRVARLAIAPAPDRFAIAVSRLLPPQKGKEKNLSTQNYFLASFHSRHPESNGKYSPSMVGLSPSAIAYRINCFS